MTTRRRERDVFVVGIGQTPSVGSTTPAELGTLIMPAIEEAMASSGITTEDLPAVAWGVSPDLFEGQSAPETWMSRTLLPGVPAFRTNTGGATGADTFVNACELVRSGALPAILVVAFQRVGLSATQRILQTIWAPFYEMPLPLNTITQAAFRASRFLGLGRAEVEDFALIASKNHFGGSKNPLSHLRKAVTPDQVRASRMLSWPVRLLEACPRSQGACAILISNTPGPQGAIARVTGWGRGHDSYWLGDRLGSMGDDVCELPALARAAKEAYAMAGIRDPRADIDVVELYAPFSSLEMMMYAPLGLLDAGEERKAVEEGWFGPTGRQRVCPSGGCQTSNPIGATGLIRVAEAALQVSGQAGQYQAPKVRSAIATSTGGASQYFSVVVLGEST